MHKSMEHNCRTTNGITFNNPLLKYEVPLLYPTQYWQFDTVAEYRLEAELKTYARPINIRNEKSKPNVLYYLEIRV